MFETASTSAEVTSRLRQDMNSGAPPSPALEPVEGETPPINPGVETAPPALLAQNRPPVYLVWLAGLAILAPALFWLLALMYVAGAQRLLFSLVTTWPFPLLVALNTALPVVAGVLAWLALVRLEAGTVSRLVAKLVLSLSVMTLAALAWWLAVEAF